MEPGQNVAPAPEPNMMAQGVSEKKKGKGMLYGMILCAVLAIGGIGFGVWMMMDGNTQKETLNTQISALKQQNNELQEKLSNVTTATTDTDTDTSTINTADYIYVGEWGLKIKIPENLKRVGYNYVGRSDDVYRNLYVSGVSEDSDGLPDFANTSMNPLGIGAVARYSLDADPEVSSSEYLGKLVFSDEKYGYYYGSPQAYYSGDENKKELEIKSIEIIKEMLTNPENYSKI